ncbi:phytoene desaturase [Weeksellaceae bacterium TAE3-ERU29]|nr:phytoene desaturase [Weeksellaceae bacterium TAE3-ERU29]
MSKKTIVIGSGFSSLATACYLQKQGKEVIVFEKNEQLGGRASILEENGFRFDMGPSWYWMPDVFEKFFNDFGKKVSDYYRLEKLSPAYRVFFGKNDKIDISDSKENIINTFEKIDIGSGERLKNFLKSAEKNYQIAMQDLVYQPGRSLTELLNWKVIKRLDLFFKSISNQTKKITKNKDLQSILEFPVLFLGAKPEDTPAFYNFMNYADFGLGTWYPENGMNSVVQAMVNLGRELGVQYFTNKEIKRIQVENGVIKGVETDTDFYEANLVVSGADYAHTETLLDKKNKNYTSDYWKKKVFAPSSLLYYVGVDKEDLNLEHHNLFFDTDFSRHAKEIYNDFAFPENPLFYVNYPSKTDRSLAPEGKNTLFFLVPVAVDLEDNKEIHEHYFQLLLKRIEKCTGEDLRKHIVYKKSFGIQDFKNRYHSCRGNAYGLANTLFQTSVLRPQINNKKVKNLFYTGQLTVPGPGVPPALISGKVVADYILKQGL